MKTIIKTITLDKKLHKGQEVLLLRFPKDERLIVVSKQLKNIRWSATHKSWYTLYNIEALKLVKQIFTDVACIDESILNEKIAKEPFFTYKAGVLALSFLNFSEENLGRRGHEERSEKFGLIPCFPWLNF